MTENTETVTIPVPSKFAVLKSKITREGLLTGGVIAGILIASGYTIFKKQVPEIVDIDANTTNIETVNVTVPETES